MYLLLYTLFTYLYIIYLCVCACVCVYAPQHVTIYSLEKTPSSFILHKVSNRSKTNHSRKSFNLRNSFITFKTY